MTFVQEQIRSLVKEAQLYRTQGLLAESREKYLKVLQFLGEDQQSLNNGQLEGVVRDRIRAVEEDMTEIDRAAPAPDLSDNVQNIIKRVFASSDDEEKGEFRGAVALAKFGQYERALREFQELLKKSAMPVIAAKNIIMCHLTFSSAEAAAGQLEQWISRDVLPNDDLKEIRSFLGEELEKNGVEVNLPEIDELPLETEEIEEEEDTGVLAISSICIPLGEGTFEGDMVEFDVTFQTESIVSVIVKAHQKDLLNVFRLGTRLSYIQCYSPGAVYRCSGTIFGKSGITYGPKKGDYALEIVLTES
jgi:tetratricopeptide (TPR) repeat protein